MVESALVTTQDWIRIAALLDDALALSPARREAWLYALGPADAALKPTLARLLSRASVETDDFMRKPVRLRHAAPAHPPEAAAQSGAVVGPYRLLRVIGSGGMGAVWLAERADGSLQRRVALKLPRMSWDTPGLAARMTRERDILAALEHPNIARLYDAGLDQMGRPYLAMEYVEGQPLDVYCSEQALDLRGRLQLFLQAARAVAHAHARLVVHRDLKPSNLLVTGDGAVHLLDFGIAKLLQGDPGAESAGETQLTRVAGQPLTPDYAAPEQIRGERITVAADVYSLGVLLFELLTGTRPAPASGAAQAPLASSVAGDRKRAAPLRGNLDTILAKALEQAPAQRYATVDAFAADVQRHLRGEPVLARPDTLPRRVSRSLRRHKVAVGVAAFALIAIAGGAEPVAAVIVALACGAAIALWQAGIARREAARAADEARAAQRERDRAVSLNERHEAMLDFMQVMLTETAAAGEKLTLSELLSRSELLLARTELGQPEQQASLLEMLASFHMSLADYGKAETMLRRADDLAQPSADVSLRARIAFNHALALAELGNVEIARRTIESWLAAEGVDAHVSALGEQYLAQIARNNSDARAALAHALGAEARLAASSHPAPVIEASIAGDIAYAYQINGRAADADRQFARAMQMQRDVGRGESATAVAILNNWAVACLSAGDVRRALGLAQEVLRVATRRAPNGVPPPYAVNTYAHALILLARYDEAWPQTERACRIADDAGATAFSVNARVHQAVILRERGDLDGSAGKLAEIAPVAAQLPDGVFAAVGLRMARATLFLRRGGFSEAAATIEPVVRMFDIRGTRVAALAGALCVGAEARWRQGDVDTALADAQRALDVSESLRGANTHSATTGHCALLLHEILRQARGTTEAASMLDMAIAHLEGALGAGHPATQRGRALAGR